jgi:hypothetical protein
MSKEYTIKGITYHLKERRTEHAVLIWIEGHWTGHITKPLILSAYHGDESKSNMIKCVEDKLFFITDNEERIEVDGGFIDVAPTLFDRNQWCARYVHGDRSSYSFSSETREAAIKKAI